MALRDQPYIPLYIDDYLTDEKLNMCSASTQGIYIKILCIMHKSDPYGTILLKQKDKQATNQTENFAYKVAKLLSFSFDEIHAALLELIEEDVLQMDEDTLSQRRMVKDNSVSVSRANAGSKGGTSTQSKIKKFAKAKNEANSVNENEIEDAIKVIKDGVKSKDRIPTIESFVEYGLEKASANGLMVSKRSLTMKYEAWKEAGWINGNGQEIRNWKSSLLNTLQHLNDVDTIVIKPKQLFPGDKGYKQSF